MTAKAKLDYPVWLSTDEAARYLGVSGRTVHVVAVPDGLPCYRFGRVYRFRLDEVQSYIAGTRVEPK
jgi:excisionase family DNA binding protein